MSAKDFVLLIPIAVIAFGITALILPSALPGSASTTFSNTFDFVPGVGADASVESNEKYELTSCITYDGSIGEDITVTSGGNNKQIIEDSFKYKTEKADGGLSLSTVNPLSITGTKDVVVEYIVRQDGRVLATEARNLGQVDTYDQKEVCFKNEVGGSGNYEVEFISSGQGYGLLGDTGPEEDKIERSIEVPKLPLGEY